MMSNNRSDWIQFTRIDNAIVIDFLSSTASAFVKHEIIGTKESDNLRLALSGVQSDPSVQDKSVLLELLDQNTEFLGIIAARYGESGVSINLMHHTLKQYITESRQQVAKFGQEILKKTELLFNRPVDIYDGQHIETRTLYSSLLVDFSEILGQIDLDFKKVEESFSVMVGGDVGFKNKADHDIDADVASTLGFAKVKNNCLIKNRIKNAKALVGSAYYDLAEACESLAKIVAANTGDKGEFPAVVACDWLRSESLRISNLDLPDSGSLTAWEIRRNNLGASLLQSNLALSALTDRVSETLSAISAAPSKRIIAESYKRRLVSDLVAAGVGPQMGWETVNALVTYINSNDLRAKDIIISELPKIHKHLMPMTLETLINMTEDDKLMNQASEEKSLTMKRSRSLNSGFQKTLAGLAPIAVAAFLTALGGCGFKTSVKSGVVEPRPDIPAQRVKVVDQTGSAVETQTKPGESTPSPSTSQGATNESNTK